MHFFSTASSVLLGLATLTAAAPFADIFARAPGTKRYSGECLYKYKVKTDDTCYYIAAQISFPDGLEYALSGLKYSNSLGPKDANPCALEINDELCLCFKHRATYCPVKAGAYVNGNIGGLRLIPKPI